MKSRTVLAVLLAALLPCVLAVPQARAAAEPASSAHPLDPLTGDEITSVTATLRQDARFPKDGLFVTMDIREPKKSDVWHFRPGQRLPRIATVAILSRSTHRSFEALVDVSSHRVTAWQELKGAQPLVLLDEYDRANDAIRKDPRFIAAMNRRGIQDMKQVAIDGWAAGPQFGAKRRVLRGLVFYQGKDVNYYGRPIEGVQALVDVDNEEVLSVSDTGNVPIPPKNQDFTAAAIGPQREAPKPIDLAMPQGASFQVIGHEVRWQNWRFRFSFHEREGLVLHQISYDDHGKIRPILYRAGLNEMIVPYGDPDPNWNWRAAFDVGEYGFGNLSSPLDIGKDVPPGGQVFDATFADTAGKPYVFPRAVGLYERDAGVLWKHYDYVSGTNSIRRARELVITNSAAVGNYDYILNWVFHQDGIIELDAVATGILLTKGTAQTKADGKVCAGCTGHLVGPNLIAPNHQHFMNYRLDFDVDGENNSVSEMNQHALPPGAGNPMGNGFEMRETQLTNEDHAQRDLDAQQNRMWRVFNPDAHNALGNTTGYALMPLTSTPPYLQPGSPARRRATFLEHQFWTTRYHADERFAAGEYPNQAATDHGLSSWAYDHESLANKDLVVWYTMGMSHAPREEEWPMMNATHLGFKLLPAGFFSSNPAMDVPPTP